MPSAIVTTTYRSKRPPRKKKPVVLIESAIARATPANGDRKSAIVTARRPTRTKRATEPPEDPEADARVKAFLARMVRTGGPLPPDASK